MAFKSASSPGSYNQLIAHDDKTTRLRNAQQKERNAQIAHNKQLADTHRQHAKSFDFGIEVEASARRNAVEFDEYVRGVNQKFELQAVQAANQTAIRRSDNRQIEQANNQAQLMGLVQGALGVGAKIYNNHQQAKKRAELNAAQEFHQKWSPSLENIAGINGITAAMWADDAKLTAWQKQKKAEGMTLADIQKYQGLSDAATTAINQNLVTGQLRQLDTIASRNSELKFEDKTYAQIKEEAGPGSSEILESLLRRQASQILNLAEKAGSPVNFNAVQELVERQIASIINSNQTAVENRAEAIRGNERREVIVNQLNSPGGMDSVLESWVPLTPEERQLTGTDFFKHATQLAAMGGISREQVDAIGETLIPGTNETIAGHTQWGAQYQELMKASINYGRTHQARDAQINYTNEKEAIKELEAGFLDGRSIDELQALQLEFKQNNVWNQEIGAYFEAAVRDMPKNQSEVEMQEMVDAYGAWAPISALEVYGDQAGKYTAKVYKLRNADPWFKGIRDQIKALGQKGLKMTGEAARAEPSYHTVVADLNTMTVGLMEKYLSQPGVTVKQAQGQVEAILLDLEKKVETDPFGDHILGVWDRSKPGAQPGFKRHREVDAIVPLSAPSLRDVSEEFANTTKNSTPEQIQEYLSTNPDALSSAISTKDAVQMLNDLHNDKAASRSALKLFANVGRYTGQGPTEAAKTLLKGRGVNYKPPENTTSKEMEKLFDATFLTPEIVTRYGGNNAVLYNSGQAVVRGEGVSGMLNPTPNVNLTANKGGYAADTGLDIHGPEGTPIVSMLPGTLIYAERGHSAQMGQSSSSKGYTDQHSVLIKLDNPFTHNGKQINYAWYTHLQDLNPAIANKTGIKVNAGQHLGGMGIANGVSHLHLGLVGDRAQTVYLNYKEVREVLGGIK